MMMSKPYVYTNVGIGSCARLLINFQRLMILVNRWSCQLSSCEQFYLLCDLSRSSRSTLQAFYCLGLSNVKSGESPRYGRGLFCVLPKWAQVQELLASKPYANSQPHNFGYFSKKKNLCVTPCEPMHQIP